MRSGLAFVLLFALAGTPLRVVQAEDELIKRGEKLYADQKCSMCHSIAAKGNQKGPLDDVGNRLSEEDVRQWLINPGVMREKVKATRKPIMAAYTKLSKEDLDALVAYVKSLKKK